MKLRFVYIHGNQTESWEFAFAPWLKAEIEKLGFEAHFDTMPDPHYARAEFWLPHMENELKLGENDVIIGWSSGGTAALRYAETHKIAGSILIAPTYTDLDDDFERASGFFDNPWDWEAIKKNQAHIALAHSDNDPYVATSEFEDIIKYTDATKLFTPGQKHYIEVQKIEEVLAYIKQTYTLE